MRHAVVFGIGMILVAFEAAQYPLWAQCPACPARAAGNLISVNLHRINCPNGQVDLSELPVCGSGCCLQDHCAVDLLSYHTRGMTETETRCVANTVLDDSRLSRRGKPKLLASDGGTWTNSMASEWIRRLAASQHYEHYKQRFLRAPCLAAPCSSPTCRDPTRGARIAGAADLPQCVDGPAKVGSGSLRKLLGDTASELAPNGILSRSGDTLRWSPSGSAIKLAGYGWTGALVGQTFDMPGFLAALKAAGSRGINLTRVWAIDQWTAFQVGCDAAPACAKTPPLGLTPFASAPSYDLSRDNPAFYQRLRQFSQEAADRGVVVQLSLFSKSGLVEDAAGGGWSKSPYNDANNLQNFLAGPAPPSAFVAWTGTPAIGEIHRRYIKRVVEEVGGVGNLIFEIINEARRADWPDDGDADTLSEMEEWQSLAIAEVHANLPVAVARDAFNGDAAGQSLAGKSADSGGAWTATGASIRVIGQSRSYNLGKVVATDATASFSGALPVALASRAKVMVRASLERSGAGLAQIGLRAPGGQAIEVELDGVAVRLRYRKPGVPPTELGTKPFQGSAASLRLRLDLASNKVSVYRDAELILGPVASGISGPRNLNQAYLAASSKTPATALGDSVAFDNFEVATYDVD